MPVTSNELEPLDYHNGGLPTSLFNAEAATAGLDYHNGGLPFYAPPASAGYSPEMSVELTAEATFTGALDTDILLGVELTAEADFSGLFMNSGTTNKMEIIF